MTTDITAARKRFVWDICQRAGWSQGGKHRKRTEEDLAAYEALIRAEADDLAAAIRSVLSVGCYLEDRPECAVAHDYKVLRAALAKYAGETAR